MKAQTAHEARNGFDGTRLAHPDQVPAALEIFNELMPTSNHLYVAREDVKVGQKELLEIPDGNRTEAGFRENIRVSLRYMEAWLGGSGIVDIDNVIVDAAAAEIARAQIWQWLKLQLPLAGGRKVTRKFFDSCLAEETLWLKQEIGVEAFVNGRFKTAIALLKSLTISKTLAPFFSVTAYRNFR